MDTSTELLTMKEEEEQYDKNVSVNSLELILKKNTLIFLELSLKYLDTLNNRL